jgi:UDP-glucose 4-epimerase
VYGSAQYAPIDEKHPLGSTSIYGASKIAGDRLCHAYAETYGMDIGILRPFNIYGPRQTAGVISIFIKNAMKCIPPSIQGDGSQSRDYIYVDDVVSAYDTMLHAKNPGIVNFGSGVDTSVKDLAEAVLKAVGNPQLSPEYKDAPANTTKKLVADITKAKSLGWSPKYDLKTGIEKFIGWTCEDALP